MLERFTWLLPLQILDCDRYLPIDSSEVAMNYLSMPVDAFHTVDFLCHVDTLMEALNLSLIHI